MAADENRRRLVLVVTALSILGLLALAGGAHYLDVGTAPGATGEGVTLVQPVPNGSSLWPYTSRAHRFDRRTLAINVVAVGPGDHVRQEFRRQVQANWTTREFPEAADGAGGNATAEANESEPILEVIDEEVVWRRAHGAKRYAYVRAADGSDQWLGESYQLYDGSYLGARHHVRAYDSPYDEWTAMQTHREYWDWFRLRHTVTSIADTQRYVDAQFLDDERIDRVYKIHLDNGNSKDGNGWATVLEFAVLGWLLVGVGRTGRAADLLDRGRDWFTRERLAATARVGVLAVAVAGLYLAVRVGGVALEVRLDGLNPKVVAGALYPVLALGLPTAAYGLSRGLSPEDAFVGAISGFVAGFVLEYGYLGLEVVPVELLLHRVALLLSLGLVAAAAAVSRGDAVEGPQLLALGVAGWIVSLGLPLLGLA